jgi:circadian clock protein KaiB
MSPVRSRPRPVGEDRRLLLFVAGDEPNSRLARANLEGLRPSVEVAGGSIEVHDVLEDFTAAMEHRILVTPALLQLAPGPRVVVVGSLCDLPAVRLALGLPAVAPMSAKAGP